MGVRRNQKKLSKAERRRFVDALLAMRAAGAYDDYVSVHETAFSGGVDANPAHMGPAFFPWHRYFLARFETELRTYDPDRGRPKELMLPYWDWTADDATVPETGKGGVFADDMLGGDGDPADSFNVRSGPFAFRAGKWKRNDGGALQRHFGINARAAALPRDTDVKRALDAHGIDCWPMDRANATEPIGAPTPNAPTANGAAGGSLAAGKYRVLVTYCNVPMSGRPEEGETRPSPPKVVTLVRDTAITVKSPAAAGSATHYRVYVSPAGGAAGTETLQSGASVALGTDTTITTLAAGTAPPRANTTGTFRNLLEGWLTTRAQTENHNRVHMWINLSMAVGTSPNDPAFFLHHCNIDRLWARWQFANPGQNYPVSVPLAGGAAGSRPHGLNDALSPWTGGAELVRPVDLLNHTSISVGRVSSGYKYDSDPPGVAPNVS